MGIKIDTSYLDDYTENNCEEMLRQINLLLQHIPIKLNDIGLAVEKCDNLQLHSVLHDLKPQMEVLGIHHTDTYEKLVRLEEKTAKKTNVNEEMKADAIDVVKGVKIALNEWENLKAKLNKQSDL